MDKKIDDIQTLINEIEKKYPYSTDATDYGRILRDVRSKSDIHNIISDIVRVDSVISKSPYYLSCQDLLYGYLNQCILNIYKESNSNSLDVFCEAYINIRAHEKALLIKETIIQIAKSRGLEVEGTTLVMNNALEEFNQNFSKLKQYQYNTNGYNQYLASSKKWAAVLINYKFDACGLHYGINSLGSNLFLDVERELEWEKEREKKEKEEILSKIIGLIIAGVILLAIIIGILFDTSATGNILIIIFIILLIIGFYSQFF